MSGLKVYAPYDEQLIDEVVMDDQENALQAVRVAHETFLARDQWLPAYQRVEILEKVAALMTQRKMELALTAAHEGGKPLTDSIIETERAINGVRVAIEQLGHMHGREVPMNITPSSAQRMAYTFAEPVGVVFAISAFNHPLNLIIHQVIPAIAVGCPVLVKPAATTPLSCLNLVNILYEAGLPKQWCQVLICENTVAEKIVGDPRVSFLSFIGSSKVGWYLRSKLAPGATCALEHGGAAPVIFEADADIEDAIPLLTKGGFYHAGQVCVSVQRLFVHQKIMKTVSKKLTELASQLVVGDPTKAHTDVGPLITTKEVKRVDDWVQQAINSGAKCLTGGERLSETCYAPTILLDPPEDAYVSRYEIFGPVICLYTYKDRLQAIQQANKPHYYFQAAVFTKNIDIAIDTVKRLDATAVMVNDHTAFRVDWMPFGGRSHSGLGLGGIPYSMHDMTHQKMMVLRSPML